MKDPKNKKVFFHDGHKRPSNRREFLASGLLGFSGYMMAPSILQALAGNIAMADDCPTGSATQMPAFVVVNLSGGAALSANYVTLDKGRNPLAGYEQLGLGPTSGINMITEFQNKVKFAGAPSSAPSRITAQFLAGIRSVAPAMILNNTAFIGVCTPTQDDSPINKLDPSGMVTAAGLVGTLLPRLGVVPGATGTNNDFATIRPPAPLIVTKIADLTSALTPSGTLANSLTQTQQVSLLKLVNKLSGSQGRAIATPNSASGTLLSKLVQCATGKNVDLLNNPNPGIDPRQDASKVKDIWGMNNGADMFGRNQMQRVVMGSMVFNAVNGKAGTIGLELGGYDYHGQPRMNTDAMDNQAGVVVGNILATAAEMQKPVFIHVQSDGGVGSSGTTQADDFGGDRGASSVNFMIAYDPSGRVLTKSDVMGYQIGQFTSGSNAQGADPSSIVGSAEKAAIAVFANYLQFAKQIDKLELILPRQFQPAEQDEVLRFA